jgi:hypothetical protein
MASFKNYVNSFKSGWAAAIGAATAGPIALFATDFSPPWPTEGGGAAGTLGTVASLIGLVIAYLDGARNQKWRRRAGIALCLAFLLMLAFIGCWSWTVVEVSQPIDGTIVLRRFVVGFTEPTGGLSPADALMLYGPDDTYSRSAVFVGRLSLLGSWLGLFALLTYGFGLLQVAEAHRKGRL